MGKTRKRAEIHSGSQVQTPSSTNKVAESAPSESIKVKEAEAKTSMDNSNKIEEKKETEDDAPSDIPQGVDEIQETKVENNKKGKENEGDENEGDEDIEEEDEEDDIEEYEDAEADDVTEKDEIRGDDKVESLADNVVAESMKAENGKADEEKEVKDNTKVGNTPVKKAKRLRKRKRKNAANIAASNDPDNSEKLLNTDKKDTSAANKGAKMADGMGLIFLCNAKTKQDCFRYKVLGQPAGKKEMVAKIYKGMRLFLYDVDLKLLYGIFRAATPGGYNLEPKAFNSAFPAQVRFSVLNDCLPLPEEKFKPALKGNYYGRNKFNHQLSQEQVKSLCKLFISENKIAKKNIPTEPVRTAEPGPTPPKRRRKSIDASAVRAETNSVGRATDIRKPEPVRANRRKRDLSRRKTREARPEPVRTSRAHQRPRQERERRRTPSPLPPRRDQDTYLRRRDVYEPPRGGDSTVYPRREVYASPPGAVLPPAPAASYDYYYARDPPLVLPPPASMVDPRERLIYRVAEVDTRQQLPRELPVTDYRDAYNLYREPRVLYSDALYSSTSAPAAAHANRDALYSLSSAPAAYANRDALYSSNSGSAAYANREALYSSNAAPAAYAHHDSLYSSNAAPAPAPAAYAPTASVAPPAYAPSSSLYYRY